MKSACARSGLVAPHVHVKHHVIRREDGSANVLETEACLFPTTMPLSISIIDPRFASGRAWPPLLFMGGGWAVGFVRKELRAEDRSSLLCFLSPGRLKSFLSSYPHSFISVF